MLFCQFLKDVSNADVPEIGDKLLQAAMVALDLKTH